VQPNLRSDLLASIVVFLVALPLCMAIANACDFPASAGLVAGIVGGLVVGVAGGAPLQVSGPAAGLVVIVLDIVNTHGVEVLGAALVVAGGLQVLAGVFRVGQWFRAVSPAVIEAMLAGIGVLIIVSQLHVMVDDRPRDEPLHSIAALPAAFARALPSDTTTHHLAALAGLVTIAGIFAWTWWRPRALASVPGALVGVVLGAGFANLLGWEVRYVAVPRDLLTSIEPIGVAAFSAVDARTLLLEGLGLAFVASAETLLCTSALDQLHRGPRADYDREIAAQGLGNAICGALGALPITGVIVRSSANVNAGGTTRRSAIFHGLWLLVAVIALPGVLARIPSAALAAILVYTGVKLIDLQALRRIRAFGWTQVAIYAATLVTIVATDLLTGVVLGLALALVQLLASLSRLDVHVAQRPGGDWVAHLSGPATFVALPKLAAALERIPVGARVEVHFDHLTLVDHACVEYLQAFGERHAAAGGAVAIAIDELMGRVDARPPRAAPSTAADAQPPGA
jgi:MFS superfamily sulfate permease-like transporter